MWNVTPRVNRVVGVALLLGAAAIGFQCSGGGSSGGGSFDVVGFSVTKQSPPVYLNDIISIFFSESVDPSSVISGIYIYTSASAGATRAQGEWKVDGTEVTFTPRLPTNRTFTDGGFLPATEYTICVPRAGDSCAVFIQNSPGVRSVGGRTVAQSRAEQFQTVTSVDPFRPESPKVRPEIESSWVVDSEGVTQTLNPIVNLITGQTFTAGILTQFPATPPTTMGVPNLQYGPVLLTRTVTSPVSGATGIISKSPLTVTLAAPIPAMAIDEFKDKGGVLTLTDNSTVPPKVASWAIDSNTNNVVVTLPDSGPDYDSLGFSTTIPLTAVVTQGITRQVAPGDINAATEVKFQFSEALNPASVIVDNFQMYSVKDTGTALQYTLIPLATTLQSAPRQGITHEVIGGKSVVTLRPKNNFPQSAPNQPVTVVVQMTTAQPANDIPANRKSNGLLDLNDFALAYPVRTGYELALDVNNFVTTVGYIQPYLYENANPPPANIQIAWGFQTRADTQVVNAIVESFSDRLNIATDCVSTAAWTKAGQAGLFGTPGYGGNAADGDQTIAGAVTLDSDTRTPGADGIVEWNFNRLVVTANGTLTLKGSFPIRINALEDMEIAGTVDASGGTGSNGPPGKAGVVGQVPGGPGGPGAGAGGISNFNPTGPIGSLPEDLRGKPGYPKANRCNDLNKSDNRLITVVEPNCGGGTGGNRGVPSGITLRSGCSGNGGGHGTTGDQTDFLCGNINSFGREFGVKWIVPTGAGAVQLPTAGTGGGAGGNAAISTTAPAPVDDIVAGGGGGGGGGLELVSAGDLDIKPSALIQSGGGSGGTGFSTVVNNTTVAAGFGAGGSGGSIWLSGTAVTVGAGSRLEALGGIGNPNPPNPPRTGDGGDGYIIIRDRGDSPDIQSNAIRPAQVQGRANFTPANNGLSEAASTWYDSGSATPNWSFDSSDPQTGKTLPGRDLSWLTAPIAGQTVWIDFQGAPDNGVGLPDPDPTKWTPANTPQNPCANWTTNIGDLRAALTRHIRFRVRFDIGTTNKGAPPPNPVAISRIVINYQ